MESFLIFVGITLFSLLVAGLIRKYNSASLINGFMDIDKAKELAPEMFVKKKTGAPKKRKKKPSSN